MADKPVKINTSSTLKETASDMLLSDCLRIEVANQINACPGRLRKINLTVHNSSEVGRVAHLKATYDSRAVSVHLPDSVFYVAPGGKTTVFAAIIPMDEVRGQEVVSFSVN